LVYADFSTSPTFLTHFATSMAAYLVLVLWLRWYANKMPAQQRKCAYVSAILIVMAALFYIVEFLAGPPLEYYALWGGTVSFTLALLVMVCAWTTVRHSPTYADHHNSQERFKRAVESAAHGIGIVGLDGRWLEVNKALCDMLGYQKDEFLEVTFQAMTHPDDLYTDLELVAECLAGTRDNYQMEKRYFTKEGKSIWVLLAVGLVRDNKGEPLYFISQVQDIDAQKRYAQKVETQAKKLSEQNKVLKHMNAELDRFAYIASHDLQEPLRKIMMHSQLLEQALPNDIGTEVKHDIKVIFKSVSRMQTLIYDLLNYSRLSHAASSKTEVNLNHVVQAALSNLDVLIAESKANVDVGDLPTIKGDEGQLVQLMQNLISNAIKFQPEGHAPRVVIRAGKQTEKEVSITVADNGIGFAKEHKKDIFQPFKRLHTQAQYPGTGIGLSICQRVVENHGGKISVLSHKGKGTTFTIVFPLN